MGCVELGFRKLRALVPDAVAVGTAEIALRRQLQRHVVRKAPHSSETWMSPPSSNTGFFSSVLLHGGAHGKDDERACEAEEE